jgi:hypothetical protein
MERSLRQPDAPEAYSRIVLSIVCVLIGLGTYVLQHFFAGWSADVALPTALRDFMRSHRLYGVIAVDLALFAAPVILVSALIGYSVLRPLVRFRNSAFVLLVFGWGLPSTFVHVFAAANGNALTNAWLKWPHVAIVAISPMLGFFLAWLYIRSRSSDRKTKL